MRSNSERLHYGAERLLLKVFLTLYLFFSILKSGALLKRPLGSSERETLDLIFMTGGPDKAAERPASSAEISTSESLPPVPKEVVSSTPSPTQSLTKLSLGGSINAVPEVQRSVEPSRPRERNLQLDSVRATAAKGERKIVPIKTFRRVTGPVTILDRVMIWIETALKRLVERLLASMETIPVLRHLHPNARARVREIKEKLAADKKLKTEKAATRTPTLK